MVVRVCIMVGAVVVTFEDGSFVMVAGAIIPVTLWVVD